jgi:pyruvyl transferase EpsO
MSTAEDARSDKALVQGLGREVERTLRPLFAGVRRVALLDYPDFPNVGDSAIWLGQLAWLRSLGLHPVYTADRKLYSPERLRRRLGDGMIVFSGGGNLGDLWEDHQHFREAVVAAFPHNRILLLPQSMHFQHPDGLARARRAFDAHPRLTLALRDRESLARARAAFRAPTLLCPDMAFCLGPLERPLDPVEDQVRLLRTDQESRAGYGGGERAAGGCDWAGDEGGGLLRIQAWLRGRVARGGPQERLRPLLSATYAPAARRRLARGLRLLSRGRRVVSDRLHAHILCLLLGIPHRLEDNSYGKNGAFYRTWTSGSELVEWCGDGGAARRAC